MLREAFLVWEAMVEEVRLPPDAEPGGCPLTGKRKQRVAVIGHQQKNMSIPVVAFVTEFNGIQKVVRDGGEGELVRSSVLTADRYKPDGLGRINPRRGLARKFATSGMHRGKKGQIKFPDEPERQ